MNNRSFLAISLSVAAGLALLTLVLHGSALRGFWRIDDSWILYYVTEHPDAAGYFFSPRYWQALGAGCFTPWLALEYRLDFVLFGLNPKMFYAHQLFIIWLAALLTLILVRRHAGLVWGGIAATLFLMGAPTTVVAQQIIARHYATGLIFAILAILLWQQASEQPRRSVILRWLATICYLLAMLNKEIFAPLPLPLFFFGEGKISWRVRAIIPLALIAASFIFWRSLMLGKFIGGYTDNLFGMDNLVDWFTVLPRILVGTGWPILALGLALLLAIGGIVRRSPLRHLLVLLATVVALLLPLLALQANADPINLRYAFVLWWGICILLTLGVARTVPVHLAPGILFPQLRMLGGLALMLITVAAVFLHARTTAKAYAVVTDNLDAHGHFMWSQDETLGYIPHGEAAGFAIIYAYPLFVLKQQALGKKTPHPFPFVEYANQFGATLPIYAYDPAAASMKLAVEKPGGLSFQSTMPLSLTIDRRDGGFYMHVEQPVDGACFLIFPEKHMSSSVPCSINIRFDPPSWLQGKFQLVVISPEKDWNASPWFDFPEKGSILAWDSAGSSLPIPGKVP
ncbi:MAG: hypothetical protein NT087_06540 [Deltaproteobacteria bacterium]|nr:hypothetical protein [Deltaproteobacteria bacterium]